MLDLLPIAVFAALSVFFGVRSKRKSKGFNILAACIAASGAFYFVIELIAHLS